MAYDVIVVGARCAGAPVAMLLSRLGRRVLLLDRARFPSDTMSTHWVLWPGIELLAQWGLLDSLIATGCPPLSRISMEFDGLTIAGKPAAKGRPAVTYAPRRTVLDQLLVRAACAAGAELREGVAVRDLEWENGAVCGVRGHGQDGRQLVEHAQVVIGADGRNSTVARLAGAQVTEDRGSIAATIYGYWSGLRAAGVQAHVKDGAGVSAWPTHGGLTVVALTMRRADYLGSARTAGETYLELLAGFPALASRLRAGQLAGSVQSAASLRNFYRESFGPGWALAGDARHHKDPIAARGISDAFTDAEVLAAAVHKGLSGALPMDRSLTRYQSMRNIATYATFNLACQQAALRPATGDLARLLRSVQDDPAATSMLLSVFAGAHRLDEVLALGSLARVQDGTSQI